MAFGIYIHIPHCLQVCPYCDFTKYELGKIIGPDGYVQILRSEIRARAREIGPRPVDTLYFGGGTPSLLDARSILAILDELANQGFQLRPDAEWTIEANPGTIDETKLRTYLDAGINRFSVGVQTFRPHLLRRVGRKHSVRETEETLTLLRNQHVNFSLDLLFALPTQTIQELEEDLDGALDFLPNHLSAYYLTVPENHPMAKGRAPEEEQTEMFQTLEARLSGAGYERYEISSYAKPGFQSRHNHLYWTDQEYWGLGVSAHSYLKRGTWGFRFWNPPSQAAYEKQIQGLSQDFRLENSLPSDQREFLEVHEALTDFCHVRLRMIRGLDTNALRLRFGEALTSTVIAIMRRLAADDLLELSDGHWRLTRRGRLLTNVVFGRLTFLAEDLGAH